MDALRTSSMAWKYTEFNERFTNELKSFKQDLLDKIPSKRIEMTESHINNILLHRNPIWKENVNFFTDTGNESKIFSVESIKTHCAKFFTELSKWEIINLFHTKLSNAN